MKIHIKKIIGNKYLYRGVGIYQISAGIFGYYLVLQQSILYILGNFLFYIVILGLFSFSIISGVYFYRIKKKGINFSYINQLLQLFQFYIFGFGFNYVAGGYLGVGFTDTPEIKFLSQGSLFRSNCFITFNSSDEISIVLNLVALGLVFYLSTLKSIYIQEIKNSENKDKQDNLH